MPVAGFYLSLAGLSIVIMVLLGPRLVFLAVVISSINAGIIGGNDFLLVTSLACGPVDKRVCVGLPASFSTTAVVFGERPDIIYWLGYRGDRSEA